MQTYEEIKRQLMGETSMPDQPDGSILDSALDELDSIEESGQSSQQQPGPKLNHPPQSDDSPVQRPGNKAVFVLLLVGAFLATTAGFVALFTMDLG